MKELICCQKGQLQSVERRVQGKDESTKEGCYEKKWGEE